jgi:aminoglycoside phosphotransferase (APT) family kinase protein
VHEWSPELVVDEELARHLIVTHFPELEVERLILVAEGWDNAVWVADEEWAFRFPRRTIAVRGVSVEIEVLPRLAPLLPLPVPVPVFHGVPGDEYPWPFFGFRFLPGREVVVAGLDDAARVQLARPLGRFLRALHERGAPAVAAVDLPRDPLGRADPQIRVPRTRGRLEELERIGVTTPVAELSALLDDAERLPLPSTAALVHGDLHSRHLLVDDDHRLTGVIDWGDLCLSDPSVDLSIVWSFLSVRRTKRFHRPIRTDHRRDSAAGENARRLSHRVPRAPGSRRRHGNARARSACGTRSGSRGVTPHPERATPTEGLTRNALR